MKSNLCRLNVIFAETIYYNFNVSHAKRRPTAATSGGMFNMSLLLFFFITKLLKFLGSMRDEREGKKERKKGLRMNSMTLIFSRNDLNINL